MFVVLFVEKKTKEEEEEETQTDGERRRRRRREKETTMTTMVFFPIVVSLSFVCLIKIICHYLFFLQIKSKRKLKKTKCTESHIKTSNTCCAFFFCTIKINLCSREQDNSKISKFFFSFLFNHYL